MKLVFVLMSIGLFLIIAALNIVPLFFMQRQLEIMRMGLELVK